MGGGVLIVSRVSVQAAAEQMNYKRNYKTLVSEGLCVLLLCFAAVATAAATAAAEAAELVEIQRAIQEKGANWTAGKQNIGLWSLCGGEEGTLWF